MLYFAPGIIDKFSDALVGDAVRFSYARNGGLSRITGNDGQGRRCMRLLLHYAKAGMPRSVAIQVEGPVPWLDIKRNGRLWGGALLSFDAESRLRVMRMRIFRRPPLAVGMLDLAWEYGPGGRIVRALRNRKPAIACRYDNAGACIDVRDYAGGYRITREYDGRAREVRRNIARRQGARSWRAVTCVRFIQSGNSRTTRAREAGKWVVRAVVTQGAPPAIVKTQPGVRMRWMDADGRLLCAITTDRAASIRLRDCVSAAALRRFEDAAVFLRSSRTARFVRKAAGRMVRDWEVTFNKRGRPVRAVNLRPGRCPGPLPDELLANLDLGMPLTTDDVLAGTRRSLISALGLDKPEALFAFERRRIATSFSS